MFRKALLVGWYLLVGYALNAQVFGGNPPSVKWQQINTDTVRVIFPQGLDSIAQRVSTIVHWLAKNNPAPLGQQFHKVNIVLQNQTTIPNAYVGLAPFRSEFQMTPVVNNFDLGSISWPDALAVHEYRHVEQFNNFRRGLSKLGYYLFGEEGWLVGINASVPGWFYEGDAVYNETITTNQGRGRIPFFLNQYKSLWLANKNYGWMTLRNGSLKHYVPDHYPLGYLLVNYGREQYGLDFWSKVTADASAFKGLFYPFQHAVKKYAGVDYKTFRKNAFDYYKARSVSKQATNPNPRIRDITHPTGNYVTNYLFPHQMEDSSLVFLEKSYRKRPSFYIRNTTGERKLRVRDIALDDQFSYRNGKLVYAAYETDPRWGWKDYSVIKILDVNSNKERSLGHRTKYFTPDISPDGNRIAVVNLATSGKSELDILDAGNGKILQSFHSTEISVFTDPKFIDNNFLVTAVRLNDGKMALAIADISIGALERLTVPSYGVIGYPSVKDGVVYFTASFTGNDEIYALRLNDKKVFRLTNTDLGNYYVNASAGKLVWSGFTADGYQLKEMDTKDGAWEEVTERVITSPVSTFPVSHAGELHDILGTMADRKFPVAKYKQGGHLFYVHSWRPYFDDPDFTYSIYSDNILNTLSTELFYHYNRNDKTNGVGLNFVYGGWYPLINGSIENTFAQPVQVNSVATTVNELETSIGLGIPLSFTTGRTFKDLLIGTNYVNDMLSFKIDSFSNINYSYLHHYLIFSQQVQRAVQHIYPRLGWRISANLRHAITYYNGHQAVVNATLYLPGIASTHSLLLTTSYQHRDSSHVLFSDQFVNARGYSSYYFTRYGRTMSRVSANYHFPIFYPDWGFANLVYFQRLRGNLFYDFERLSSRRPGETKDLRSVGGELYLDTRWWNEYPLTFGIRFSHLLDNGFFAADKSGSNVVEFIIPIVIPE